MGKNRYQLSTFIGIFMLVIVLFMGGIFLALGRDEPPVYKFVFLSLVIGIPLFIFLKVLHAEHAAVQLSERGVYRAARLESAETEPGSDGRFKYVFRFEDDGGLLEHTTAEKPKKDDVGKRLLIQVDPLKKGNYRVMMDTLGDSPAIENALARQAEADGAEEEYDGPLNDAMLVQEREESARRRESGSSGEGRSAAYSGGKSSSKGKKNK